MNDPSSPQGQLIAESRRRREQQRQDYEQYSDTVAAERKAYEEAKTDYYRSLREKNSDLGWNFSDEALRFIAAAQPAIETAEDPQYMKERIAAADMYSDLFNVSFENAFLNLENYHQQWMGQNFVKKTGWEAVADSVKLSFVSREYNELTKKLAKQGGTDPDLLKAVQEYEQKIDQLRDHAPKIWQDDHVKMGGWDDVGQLLRGVGTSLGENALPILEGMGWATLAATGVGALGASAGLSAGLSKLLVAGASRLAIAGSTYNSTWGIKYREMTNQGIPHDIAINYARLDALIEGAIEGTLGGVEAAGAQTVMKTVVPEAVSKATTRFFISGRMGSAVKAVLNWLKEGVEEDSEELLQGLSSGGNFNAAVDLANNARREEQLRKIAAEPFEEIRKELEKELENLPEIEKKKWGDIFDEAFEGGIAGFLTGLALGIPVEIANYRHDVRSALQLAEMAQAAPNEAVFKEMVEKAKGQGFQVPMAEEMKSDEEAALLSDVYKVQQERMTPEQREAKQKQVQNAAALSEVTDYRNTETIERTDEETGETTTELSTPDTEKIYRENGRLEVTEYTDTNEDGSINGRYVAGDPRINDAEQTGANQYGYINYTQNGDAVTIDEFKMLSGYENLRADLFQQFSERFAGMDIVWNPQNEQNITLRDQLVNQNPRGIKNGLNYYENNNQIKVSNEARQVAARFTPYLKNGTQLETALAAELFNNFYRHRGESLNGAMNRLLGRVTNEAPAAVRAAQREGKVVNGATWIEKTADGMKRIVYLSKNSSNASTVIHEISHAVEADFTDAERNIAIEALNGYQLKNGTVLNLDKNTPWAKLTQEQRDEFSEGFAEALENYLTNGTAPNEQIKSLFEKIKEFMKRIYQTIRGWTELSPKVEEFYKSFLSGELVDQAKTAPKTLQKGHSEAQTGKTINDTGETWNATEAPQEGSMAISPTVTIDHIINSPDIPLEEKTEAVLDEAGEALYQAGENKSAEVINIDPALITDENGNAVDLKNTRALTKWIRDRYQGMEVTISDDGLHLTLTRKGIEASTKRRGEQQRQMYAGLDRLIESAVYDDFVKGDEAHPKVEKQNIYYAAARIGKKLYSVEIKVDIPVDKTNPNYYKDHTITEIKIEPSLYIGSSVTGPSYQDESSILRINIDALKGKVKPSRIEGGTLFQAAYHGSPYRFDRFDSSHIGEGEGAQAFGYGHYFTSKKEIAENYRETLSSRHGLFEKLDKQKFNGRTMGEWYKYWEHITDKETPHISDPRYMMMAMIENIMINHDYKTTMKIAEEENYSQEAIEWFKKTFEKKFKTPGQTYEVDIPEDDEMLDWDKPFSEQPEKVKTILRQEKNTDILQQGKGDVLSVILDNLTEDVPAGRPTNYTNNPTGEELYNALRLEKDTPKTASEYLNSLGIKGIRYLDGISRSAGEGSYNYVIFDDASVNITNTLFQLSDEQKETIEAAKEFYGTTNDFREAGYLLTDGTMLDLSGKKDGGEAGQRAIDHRDLNYFEHKGKFYKPGMDGFMSMGNIRLKLEMGGIELTKSPNKEQTGTLRNYIKYNKGDVIIDFSIENLDVENSIEYSGTNSERVLNDIKNYHEKGELPPEVPILFQTAWNASAAMFDRFDNYYAGKSGFTKTHGWGHSFYSQREAADWFSKKLEEYKGASGWLYEAKIPDDTELLDWEKPLYNQPEVVKNTAVQLITWDKDGKSNFNDAYNLRKFKDGKYGFFRSINGKMKWETIEEAKTAAKSEIMKALDGKGFYSGIAQLIGEKNTSLLLDTMGIKGIKYLDKTTEKMGLQTSHSYTVFGDQHISMTPLLFQIGDRDMVEEAASYDNWENWRDSCYEKFDDPMGEHETELDPWATQEEIDAWFKSFWENSRKAVKTANVEEQSQEATREGKATPAELDREFIEEIEEEGALEDFIKTASVMYHEDYSHWGAMDEKDAAERDRQAEISDNLRKELKHPTWETALKAKSEINEEHRKKLLTMIKHSPRDYRAIYAAVMEREDFAVSAEDRTAEILKHRITDSRRKDINSLTPEKLRQLSEQLDIEEFAELVRTGRAKFNDPIEKAYINQLKDKITQMEEEQKEFNESRDEDNQYIERIAGKEFLASFERATKAAAFITVNNKKLAKALKTGEKDAARITRQLQRANSNYNSIVQTLQAIADEHKLELDIKEALSEQAMKDYAKSAKTEATLLVHLARKAEREKLTAHLAELKEKQQAEMELTKAKKGMIKRTLRSANPRSVDAEHGMAMAVIQKLAESSMLEGLDRFIGGIEKPYLREIFERWNSDEQLRNDTLKNKARVTQEKMNKLLSKKKFEELTNADKKYLFKKIPPKDWATALGLEEIINRRNENYPNMNGEVEKQIALKYLPSDVYYRLLEKPFSEWELSEVEELAKIIDNLYIKGKEIYKANIDAERRRIREYQNAVRNTIRTVIKKGQVINDEDEAEKILGKYDEGVAGTAQGEARRRKVKAPLFGYADMNVYRFARMLDNGDTNGKNSAALYRRASDAYNQEKIAVDTRTDKIQKLMKDLKISESELWEKSVEIDLTVDAGLGVKGLGKETFTASELLGVISASRDEYSRGALIFGNFLTESERGLYQRPGVTRAELTPLELIAEERFSKVEAAAKKLLTENPNYQELLDAIDEDFTVGGQRLSESLLRYNNTYMPIVKNYFPMHRTGAVSANTEDAQLARELMGTSNGAFNLFVEKGFTNKRQEIPPQYQTGIKLDILGVWTEAVNKEEHFMAYGQLVKDLNQIYKNSRQVKDAIQKRYGRQAVEYINKYINELTTPNHEKVRSAMDNFVRSMRGKTASAFLAWKTSSIVKQFLTSPAPFFAYMNPIEYWGTFVEYAAHRGDKWNEIISLSAHMKHRDANLLIEIVNEQAKQKFENKADAFISKFNKRGMEGLKWIDEMCVAPGWLVLFRKEQLRLTKENANGTMSEKDISVKAAQYADDIVRLTQPSSRVDDLAPLFKGNNEFTKAFLQFTQSLNVIWQNIRYDLPQMIRDRRYKNAAGTIIGYTIAGIMLGAITAGFDDDDDTPGKKAKKYAWWATTQFTDAFPLIGSEATHFAELLITGKMQYSSGINLLPTLQKGFNAGQNIVKGLQQGEFDNLLKATAQAAEAAAMAKGLPVSGAKELSALLGIGDGEPDFNPEVILGRR